MVAAFVSVSYGVVHVLGWREHVSAIYGTSSIHGPKILMGLAYASAYFAFVLVAPVLALAAGIFAMLRRLVGPNR